MSHRHNRGRRAPFDELNRGDYRGDFGPEGSHRFEAPRLERRDDDDRRGRYGDPRSMRRADERQREPAGRWPWRRGNREGWQRGRISGGYGSQYDAWSQGVGAPQGGFGLGPAKPPARGGFEDQDWQPTRPARGRGVWAGDWENEEAARRDARENYRGPRGYRRADDRIHDEACERLTDDSSVDATDIALRVEDGEVTLTGFVTSRGQKRRAEECVESIQGVHDVINQLRVSREHTREQGGEGTEGPAVAADRGSTR